jgi:hypothetical protein
MARIAPRARTDRRHAALLPHVDRLAEPPEVVVDRAGTQQRGLRPGLRALLEGGRDVLQGRRELRQHGLGRLADDPDDVDRQDQQAHDQRGRGAHGRVE